MRNRFFFFLLFLNISLWAQNFRQNPAFEPLFSINQTSLVYSADQIFQLGLLFSECQPSSENWENSIRRFNEIKEKVTSSQMLSLDEEERGRAILKFLYQDYLRVYRVEQTKLDQALETGQYNCVSSAVLYLAAAKAAGLNVRGQRTSKHAFCSVYIPGKNKGQYKKIDVETTNPYGFNPGSKEAIEKENEIKGYYVVPKKYYSNCQESSDGVFVGLIAGNLCSDYIKNSNYSKAIPLAAARYSLVMEQKNKEVEFVRSEFDILPVNYLALHFSTIEDSSSSLAWFASFIDRWQMTSYLQENFDAAMNNFLLLCLNNNQYELAASTYKIYQNYVSIEVQSNCQEILTDLYISQASQGLSDDEVLELLISLTDSSEFSSESAKKRLNIYLENAWITRLNVYMNCRDFDGGYVACKNALKNFPDSSKIKNFQNVFYRNIIVVIHNNFVKKANMKEFEEAKKILEEGLKKFPNDKNLKKDYSELLKLMG